LHKIFICAGEAINHSYEIKG